MICPPEPAACPVMSVNYSCLICAPVAAPEKANWPGPSSRLKNICWELPALFWPVPVSNRLITVSGTAISSPVKILTAAPTLLAKAFWPCKNGDASSGPPALTPYRSLIEIPGQYWDNLQSRDLADLGRLLPARAYGQDGLIFQSFQEEILLDRRQRCLLRRHAGVWEITADPQLELVVLLYLNTLTESTALIGEFISVADLKEAHYFTGPHQLPLEPLLARYGQDLPGFKNVSLALGGEPVGLADVAFAFRPLPRVPLYYLLWLGDDEFPPLVNVLFDRAIETCFSASGIWLLVNLVSSNLLRGSQKPPAA